MSKALVSIIVPAYFAERHLAEMLTGVSRQTMPQWELILVEDGSKTATEAIVKEFEQRHSHNRVVYERLPENRGQSAARNRAIERCEGEFIAFLDADDIWLPDHLEAAIQALSEKCADIAYSTAIMFDDETHHILGVWGPTPDDLDNFPASLLSRSFIVPSATVLRKHALDQIGLFDLTLREGTEDFDLWLRALRVGIKFTHFGDVHCMYRKGHEAAATSARKMHLLSKSLVQVLRHHIFEVPGLPRSTARKVLSDAYLNCGHHNTGIDPPVSRSAYWNAWKLNPRKPSTNVFLIISWVGLLFPWIPKFLMKVTERRRRR